MVPHDHGEGEHGNADDRLITVNVAALAAVTPPASAPIAYAVLSPSLTDAGEDTWWRGDTIEQWIATRPSRGRRRG